MRNVQAFGQFIDHYQHERNGAMVDRAHAVLLYGTILSSKPKTILELGIGTGLLTITIAFGIRYNEVGTQDAVDNFVDWEGERPSHITQLEELGVNVITQGEKEFVEDCTKTYDMIVVDGDHAEGQDWAEKIFNMVNPGGVLFSHDVRLFPKLCAYMDLAELKGWGYRVFDENTLREERCERGWFVAHRPY